MEKWIHDRLSDCLDFPVPDDLVQYVMSMENNRDLEEYLKTLINYENPKHRAFLNELIQKKSTGPKSQSQGEKAMNKKKKFNKVMSLNPNAPSVAAPVEKVVPSSSEEREVATVKKKQKFVNLYSQEGQNREIVLLKGRHLCECQASKHKLINNCIQCGRIICQQEGSGPCLFCGNLVCSPEEQQVISSTSKKSSTLYNRLMEQKRPQGWEAALAQRNRLLEYDRTSERRTRVTDDDNDYFSSGSVWLNKAEREKLDKYQTSLKEKKHASRLHQTFTLDFAGRQLVEENNYVGEVDEKLLRDITKVTLNSNNGDNKTKMDGNNDADLHPLYNGPAPIFDTSVKSESVVKVGRQTQSIQRVQDAALQEMGDRGSCLSMHQPWASLLVTGIKIHEGRSWYTSHRGRLWIASTVQPPNEETTKVVENMYTNIYADEKIVFPKYYPTGCLLGCITVDECLSQEEYQQKYPGGESESPYVLICSNPMSLPLRFPMSGKHKIYVMDSKIHQAAIKSLQKMAKVEASI